MMRDLSSYLVLVSSQEGRKNIWSVLLLKLANSKIDVFKDSSINDDEVNSKSCLGTATAKSNVKKETSGASFLKYFCKEFPSHNMRRCLFKMQLIWPGCTLSFFTFILRCLSFDWVDPANATLSSDGKDLTICAIYEYSVWDNPGEKLTFVAWDPRNDGEKMLFYPRELLSGDLSDRWQFSSPCSFIFGSTGSTFWKDQFQLHSGVHVRIVAMGDNHITGHESGESVF